MFGIAFRSSLCSAAARAPSAAVTLAAKTNNVCMRGMAALKQPKRTKFRKAHKGRVNEIPCQSSVDFGDYGIRVLEPCKITAAQLESIRTVLARLIKPYKGKLWMRVFPDIPVSSKPAEVRMGKGKGAVDYWVARVRPNKIIFEVGRGVPEEAARAALKQAAYKLGVETKFVQRVREPPASLFEEPLPNITTEQPPLVQLA